MPVRHVKAVIHAVRFPEIKRRALHGKKDVRAEMGIVLHGSIRLDGEEMIHHIASIGSLEIEIGMIGKVYDRRLVSRGPVLYLADIVICPPISYIAVAVAREAFLPIRAEPVETDSGPVFLIQKLIIPDEAVEAQEAAVALHRLAVELLVRNDIIPLSVNAERRPVNPVSGAAYYSSHKAFLPFLERFYVAVSDHDIVQFPIAVRHVDADDPGAVVSKRHAGPAAVAEGNEGGFPAGRQSPEILRGGGRTVVRAGQEYCRGNDEKSNSFHDEQLVIVTNIARPPLSG